MWNASLVERIALLLEAELLVEGHRLHLCMQVWFADAEASRLFEQPEQDLQADSPAALPGNYRDSPDLTGGVQSAGANWVTVQAGKDMDARRILVIPFLGFRDLLLFDEYGATDPLEQGTLRVPVCEGALHLRIRHGRRP